MKARDWPKVEELYHAALGKQPAEREAFLDQACGGDEELRREVQSLLGYEREAERLMEGHKVLPTEIATAPERLRRFEQESRAAASLNHPHI